MAGTGDNRPDPMNDVRAAKAALIEFGVGADIEMTARLETTRLSVVDTLKKAGPLAAVLAGSLGFFSIIRRLRSSSADRVERAERKGKRKAFSVVGMIGLARVAWPIVGPWVTRLVQSRRGY